MNRKLGYGAALSLVVGNIIGVGIFTTTGFMAQYIRSPLIVVLAWLVGALYALSGAIVYGILVKHYPLSGGDYQYLSRAIHPFTGYVFGWSCFFVTYSGSIAALSIGAAIYLGGLLECVNFKAALISIPFLSFELSLTKVTAIVLILIFSWINLQGIMISGRYQIILTATIFIFLLLFSFAGTISSVVNFDFLLVGGEIETSISGFFTALVAVLFSYMGWTSAVYVAEEINKAAKTIPHILLIGVLLVGFIYLWTNLVYLIAVPLENMIDVVNVAAIVSTKLWGNEGNIIISGFVFIAILSSLNSTILSGPRIYMAMGRDNYFYSITKKIHQKYYTPANALMLQAAWCIILVISGSFNQLLSFVVFIAIIFSILAGLVSFYKKPQRLWQTMAIIFYLAFCTMILINTLWQRPYESIIGMMIVGVAIPFYFIEQRRRRNLLKDDSFDQLTN